MDFAEILKNLETKMRGIACKITDNKADQDDLMQEMRLYLWENREELKNKTEFYLLKACYFQAMHFINQGKSIDSKSRKDFIIYSLDYKDNGNGEKEVIPISNLTSTTEGFLNKLIAKDLEQKIRDCLNRRYKKTYDLLLRGWTLREIASEENLTYEAIRMRVKKIREIAKNYLVKNLYF